MEKKSLIKPVLSFMIVPPSGKRTISLRIPIFVVKIGAAVFSLIVIFAAVSFLFSIHTNNKLSDYKVLKQSREQQVARLQEINRQMEKMKNDLKILIDKESQIQDLLGEKGKRKIFNKKIWNIGKKKLSPEGEAFENDFYRLNTNSEEPLELQIDKRKNFMVEEIMALQESLTKLCIKANKYKLRYMVTPSIWPIYGRIRSSFGWRKHPIMGIMANHSGVDIPSWVGNSIRVTADGNVVFTGWWSGYGLAVIVDHGFGLQTIYAHCSKIYINSGDRVKKGQKIAAVGSTGISTGPHLHYEVRRGKQAVNPVAYLGIDIFTASRTVW